MENISMKVEGDNIIVTISTKAPGHLSGTGKTMVVATTNGFTAVECKRDGFRLSINAIASR